MSLSQFDPELMRFVSMLARQKKMLTPRDAGKLLGVSDRTVRRWLAFLRKQCFDYYPYINCEALGLKHYEVLLQDIKDEKIYSILPHSIYLLKGQDLMAGGRHCTMLALWVPKGSERDFRNFWRAVEKSKLAKCTAYEFEPPVEYYAPFHEAIGKDGELDFEQESDHSFFSKILREGREEQKFEPILVPIIFEMMREHWSARLIWLNAKRKIARQMKHYFRGQKINGSDQMKIFQMGRKLDYLQENFEKFFRQIRIVYGPFSQDKLACLVYFDFGGDVAELAEKVASKTLLLNVRKSPGRKSFYFLTSGAGFNGIIKDLASSGCRNIQLIIGDKEGTDYYFKKRRQVKFQYWDVFEPETGGWKFELEKYLKRLDELKAPEHF
jgi:hypothetical protein